jgi:hypothetical protein
VTYCHVVWLTGTDISEGPAASINTVLPWNWRKQVPRKCWYLSTKLHGIISQKTVILIFTASKSINLIRLWIHQCSLHPSIMLRSISILSSNQRIGFDSLKLSPLGMLASNGSTAPALDDRWVWYIWWNENWQGHWNTQRKPVPVPLCPTQIQHDLSWDWIWATRVESWLFPYTKVYILVHLLLLQLFLAQ